MLQRGRPVTPSLFVIIERVCVTVTSDNEIKIDRKQVKEVLPKLFKRYPTSEAYLRGRLKTQENMLKPLGMWSVRAKRLRQMSKEYLTWDGKEASDLYGIGKYGSDSYKIFYKNEIPDDVQDKELKRYVEQL